MTQTDRIIAKWRQLCRDHAIPLRPPAPLLNPDPTVLLVNAGITPFKLAMLAGEPMDVTAIVQPCLRTYWKGSGRFAFDMLTIVGARPDLDRAARLAVELLSGIGFAMEDIASVADEDDPDVIAVAEAMTGRDRVKKQRGNNDAYWTRWQFGHGEALSGRGLTLVHTGDSARKISLGNVIIVSHLPSGRSYFDIGFGVERLGSVFFGGDEWAPTAEYQRFPEVMAIGFSADKVKAIANYIVAARRMIDAGAVPGPKGAAYLLRRLVRSAVDMVIEAMPAEVVPEDAVLPLMEAARLLLTPADECTLQAIIGEINGYLLAIDHGLAAAQKRLQRRGVNAITSSKLRDTLGLPHWTISRLLQEVEPLVTCCNPASIPDLSSFRLLPAATKLKPSFK